MKREKLLKSPEYWFEESQNELYRQVSCYLETNNITQSDLAKKLNVSKGYISQILNGNFNFTLKKLIETSLAIGLVPKIEYKPVSEVIKSDVILYNVTKLSIDSNKTQVKKKELPPPPEGGNSSSFTKQPAYHSARPNGE